MTISLMVRHWYNYSFTFSEQCYFPAVSTLHFTFTGAGSAGNMLGYSFQQQWQMLMKGNWRNNFKNIILCKERGRKKATCNSKYKYLQEIFILRTLAVVLLLSQAASLLSQDPSQHRKGSLHSEYYKLTLVSIQQQYQQ